MSDTRAIAEHVTSVCAGAVALTLPAAAAVAPMAMPLAGLAAIGLGLRNSCAKRAGDRAVTETLAAMERAGEFRQEDVGTALQVLKNSAEPVLFSAADLAAASRAGPEKFNGELARRLAGPLIAKTDPSVERVLDIAFKASVAVFRQDETFNRDLTQTLLIDAASVNGLQLSLLDEINRTLDELQQKMGNLSVALDNLQRLSRKELEALAYRFEIERGFSLTQAELCEALEKKAEEYHAYRALIEAIDERARGLGNLKAAARDAAERLDFDEVEALLSQVHVAELEVAADTAVLRADNALLRGRVEDAFTLLSAAADSFGGVGSLEVARRRVDFEERLFSHGLRYGGMGLALSERMIRRALEALSEMTAPNLWANAQVRLGNALKAQGERKGGEVGGELLGEAVSTYRAVLRVWTEAGHPVEWAGTQSNLGNALRAQGERLGGELGAGLLSEAVSACRAALRVRTEAAHSVAWAATQNNLGNALRAQGERLGDGVGARLLGEAVSAYRAALRVRTEAAHPVAWAMTQSNLGNALQLQGARLGGEAGTRLLGEAVSGYRAALQVRTEAAHPVDWAGAQSNLGLAQEALADSNACSNPLTALKAAETCFAAALRVYDPEHMPEDHGRVSASLARVRARLGREGA